MGVFYPYGNTEIVLILSILTKTMSFLVGPKVVGRQSLHKLNGPQVQRWLSEYMFLFL